VSSSSTSDVDPAELPNPVIGNQRSRDPPAPPNTPSRGQTRTAAHLERDGVNREAALSSRVPLLGSGFSVLSGRRLLMTRPPLQICLTRFYSGAYEQSLGAQNAHTTPSRATPPHTPTPSLYRTNFGLLTGAKTPQTSSVNLVSRLFLRPYRLVLSWPSLMDLPTSDGLRGSTDLLHHLWTQAHLRNVARLFTLLLLQDPARSPAHVLHLRCRLRPSAPLVICRNRIRRQGILNVLW